VNIKKSHLRKIKYRLMIGTGGGYVANTANREMHTGFQWNKSERKGVRLEYLDLDRRKVIKLRSKLGGGGLA